MSDKSHIRQAVFMHSTQLERYSYPSDSPFITRRAKMTRKILQSIGMLSGAGRSERSAGPAGRDVLEKFHSPRYLDVMGQAEAGQLDFEGLQMGLGRPDCPVFKGMCEYAALACGATLEGARLILDGAADIAFNPSGGYHHAGPARASGFCYINDVALACMLLAERRKRVLYLDIDVHHGDGVQNAFYDRRDVLTVSLHQSGRTLFPGTGFPDEIGTGAGRGFSVNVPLPVGTYDEAYIRAFQAVAVPLIGSYDPDVIVLELGMDGLASDPLANLSLTNNTHADVIETLLTFAKPILATGGGGYHPANTARGWALAWCIMCGEGPHQEHIPRMGGVMAETTEWQGGLRDRALAVSTDQREHVGREVQAVIEAVKKNVFPLHGL